VHTAATVPYVGPGPRVVELSNVRVLRCTACGHLEIQVPEPRALDTLTRCLAVETPDYTPTLSFEEGRWRVVPRKPPA
jgi:hypothetical protein